MKATLAVETVVEMQRVFAGLPPLKITLPMGFEVRYTGGKIQRDGKTLLEVAWAKGKCAYHYVLVEEENLYIQQN